ncbi:Hypothetical predicted protein [Olea europaea subsp. europaea]|uniref:Uncharacterized protein n=1 Tax=Olea europaea subsp. europaea TaxID=158383 RepID=A0A8S0UWA1_OLEEU|nr:Hypothetical predicted protein [Olea europaea subsp. europaea]
MWASRMLLVEAERGVCQQRRKPKLSQLTTLRKNSEHNPHDGGEDTLMLWTYSTIEVGRLRPTVVKMKEAISLCSMFGDLRTFQIAGRRMNMIAAPEEMKGMIPRVSTFNRLRRE